MGSNAAIAESHQADQNERGLTASLLQDGLRHRTPPGRLHLVMMVKHAGNSDVNIVEIFLGILQGFRVTASVTAYGLLFAVPFALVLGVAQYLTHGAPRLFLTAIIEFWRSSAVIVLLFLFYYTLPIIGIHLQALTVGAMVLGLNAGGYGSQAVRAGLQSLDRGQVEAALALGLPRRHVLWLVELPQALTRMAPTFINQFIQLIKGTALVSLVTLTDMTFRAKEIAEFEYNPVGVYTSLLLAYFMICYPVTVFGRWVESRLGAGRELASEL